LKYFFECVQSNFESKSPVTNYVVASPYLLLHGGAVFPLGRITLGVDAAGETHFLRMEDASKSFSPNFALRASAGLGVSF
jgi:hypothetical protein